MFTHSELLREPSRLLRPGNPENAFTFAEGAVAAVLNDECSVITSPNCTYIPRPPLGVAKKLRMMRDLYFGEEDYLVWPQYYDAHLPHLPFIRLRTEDIVTPNRGFLWESFNDSDFLPYDRDCLVGLGRVRQSVVKELMDHYMGLQGWLQEQRNQGSSRVALNLSEEKLFSTLSNEVALTVDRLQNVPTGIRVCRVSHRHLQRLVLEFEAMCDYLLRDKEQVGNATQRSKSSNTVGAFVHTARDAQRFYYSNVSFWLVRPSEHLVDTRIDDLTPLQEPDDRGLSSEVWSLFRPIDEGVQSTQTSYMAIHEFGSDLMRWAEPFSTPGVPAFLSSRSASRMSDGRQRYMALDKRQRSAKFTSPYAIALEKKRGIQFSRSKFDDPDSPLYPPAIPAWKNAQLNVDQDTARFIFERCRTDMGYVVPEPAWLVSTQKQEKSRAMFRSWLRYRPALLYRLSSPAFKVLPIHTDAWSALIAAEYIAATAKNRDAKAQAYRREKLKDELLLALGQALGDECDVQLGTLEVDGGIAQWQGYDFEELQDVHFEQILWEMCEVNFRFEFQALNWRVGGDRCAQSQKLVELLACFPGGSLAVSMATANRGIASAEMRERAHYLFAMARVMVKWPGIHPKGWIVKREKLTWSAGELRLLEEEIATVYTQSFFNNFRRAAVLPRRLSSAAFQGLSSIVSVQTPVLAPVLDNDPRIVVNTVAV